MKKNSSLYIMWCHGIIYVVRPSLLDLQNENTLSTGIYWKTESDIEAGVIAVYGMFYRQEPGHVISIHR